MEKICLIPGVYIDSFDNSVYRFESTYNIRFNSQKGLYAINKIKELFGENSKDYVLYHIYVDLLFDAVGMLNNRFVWKSNSTIPQQIVDDNIKDYGFNASKYPILCRKDIRNFIAHIDERYLNLIEIDKYYGTFNVIFPNMEATIQKDLSRKDRPQNNILDLTKMTYKVLDLKAKEQKPKFKEVDLLKLERELKIINKRSNLIWDVITKQY